MNPAPVEWLQRIRKVTEEHGILLIVDEVQAGFARTGKFFAFEHAGIQPDIIVMSKAVGGGCRWRCWALKSSSTHGNRVTTPAPSAATSWRWPPA